MYRRLCWVLGVQIKAGCRACRGVFGCHAALVLRRLQRICQREYRREPRFMVASATIANPQEHIQQLLGETWVLPLAMTVLLPQASASETHHKAARCR